MSNLLVVDDDPDVAELLASALADKGYDVRTAENGEHGLAMITLARPDVVLLDVEMPVLDGPAMVCRLQHHNAGDEQIPIVLLSGVRDLAEIARQVGTPYFLGKPYRIAAILVMVEHALTERRSPNPQPRALA